MPKKIIDIFPPNKEVTLRSVINRESKEEKPKKGLSVVKKLSVAFFLILMVIFAYVHFFLDHAEIVIWPKTRLLNFTEKVTIDPKAEKSDFKEKVIPGKIFETEKTLSDEFLASGSVTKKAEGTIRIYNSFTTQTETWREGTRFVSSEGKLFLSKNKINVPGATLKEGKITPSFVDVEVIAAEPGAEYNIGPSKFSIAAFLGTARYTKYYGESFQPMSGGGQAPQVTKDDLEKAEKVLIEKIKSETESDLKAKNPERFIVLGPLSADNILEKNSSAKEGDEMDKFKFEIKAKLKGLSFESKDFKEWAFLAISSNIPTHENFNREDIKTEYQVDTFLKEADQLLISLSATTKTYSNLDLDLLKKSLRGKSLQEAKLLLSNQKAIDRSEIRIFPFWLRKIPNQTEKINISLKIK
jgi:hypothetical protein